MEAFQSGKRRGPGLTGDAGGLTVSRLCLAEQGIQFSSRAKHAEPVNESSVALQPG